MATDLERLNVVLQANISQFEKQLQRASRTMNQQTRAIENRWKQTNRTLSSSAALPKIGGAAAGAFGALFSADQVRQLLDASTRINNALKQTGLSGAELDKVYNRLSTSAKKNFAPVESLVQLYSKLSLTQKELGVSQEELLQFTDKVGVALRASGTSAEQASGALLQLSQALGGGTVRAEEFNSVLEGAPGLAKAAALGMDEARGSVARLRTLVISGEVSSKEFFDAITKGAAQLEKQVGSTDVTLSGAFTNLGTTLIDITREFDKTTGASKALAEFLNGPFTQTLRELGAVLSGVSNGPVGDFIKGIDDMVDAAVQGAADIGKALGTDQLGASLGAKPLGADTKKSLQDIEKAADEARAAVKKYLEEFIIPRKLVTTEQLKQLEDLKGRTVDNSDEAKKLKEELERLASSNPQFQALADQLIPLLTALINVQNEAKKAGEALSDLADRPLSFRELENASMAGLGNMNTERSNFITDRNAKARGRYEAWEIIGKTTEGRWIVVNPEGGLSTEISETVKDPRGAGFINVPTLFSGKPVPIDEAVDRIIKNGFKDPDTGRAIENFKTVEEAVEAAIARSLNLTRDPKFKEAEGKFLAITQPEIEARTKVILAAAEEMGVALTEGAARIQAASEVADENLRKVSDATTTAATELIKQFEGFRATPYFDRTALRAGFGSDTVTLDDGSVQRITRGMSVTLEQANRDLARRIGEFQSVIERQIGSSTFRSMSENQQAALTSIAYNYGSLPERIVEAIKTGNVETISNAIRGLGGDNGGINAGRRNKEADIFESGASDLVREDIELRRQQAEVIRQTMDAIRQQNAAIGEETALLGTSNAEKERARLVTETLNELQRQGIEITDELRAQVEAEAGARYNQVQAYDQAIAKTEELKKSQEELARIQEEVGSAFSGAIKGFISDLAHGKSLTEALTNAVSRLADRLLDIALDNLFSSFMTGGGGGGGGFGGILRSIFSIFGFAKGGYTGDGGKHQPAGVVHRGEFVVNKEATAQNRALLEAMNDRRKLPGFASGGFVGFGEGYSLPKMFGTGGGGSRQLGQPANINLNMNVYAQDAQSFIESRNQIAARTANALRPALRTT